MFLYKIRGLLCWYDSRAAMMIVDAFRDPELSSPREWQLMDE